MLLFFLELIGAFGRSWGLVLYGQVRILKTLITKKIPVFQKKIIIKNWENQKIKKFGHTKTIFTSVFNRATVHCVSISTIKNTQILTFFMIFRFCCCV